MSAKKLVVLALLVPLLSTFLFPQSLAEIARKERERRAALKGKKAPVVTNATLAKLKKKPALETPPVPPGPVAEEVVLPEASPLAAAKPQEPPALAPSALENPVLSDVKALQERWEKAKEYVELLTLKMGALWQQFYSLEDMTTKDVLQQSIAETFIKLQQAQEEESLARQELEKALGQQKREPDSSIWIR
jgi:hypothetical protein